MFDHQQSLKSEKSVFLRGHKILTRLPKNCTRVKFIASWLWSSVQSVWKWPKSFIFVVIRAKNVIWGNLENETFLRQFWGQFLVYNAVMGLNRKNAVFSCIFCRGIVLLCCIKNAAEDRFRWFSPFCVKLQFFKLCTWFLLHISFLLRAKKLLSRDDNGRYEKRSVKLATIFQSKTRLYRVSQQVWNQLKKYLQVKRANFFQKYGWRRFARMANFFQPKVTK